MKRKYQLIILVLTIALSSYISLSYSDNYFETSKNIDIFTSIYKELNTFYVDETDPGILMQEAIDAMLKSLDPYTQYIPESEIEDFRLQTTGQYGGIGAMITKIEDYVVISLYVDEKILLSEDEQEVVFIKTRDGNFKKKKIRRIGDKWSTLQSLTFANNTQPLHVLMTPDERLLGNPVGYSYARNANNYVDYLECGLQAFESMNTN